MQNTIQKILDNETSSPTILFKFKDFIFIRFGLISSISSLVGVFAIILTMQFFKIDANAIQTTVWLIPVSLVFFSYLLSYVLKAHEIAKDLNKIKNISFCFFGGILGTMIAFGSISYYYRINFLLLTDAGFLFWGLIHGLSRFSCINYGCCHGKEIPPHKINNHKKRLHLNYTNEMSKAVRVSGLKNKNLYPVQFYEIVCCFTMQIFMLALLSKCSLYIGIITSVSFLIYGSFRFILEFYRGEADTKYYLGFSEHQLIALLTVFWAAIVFIYSINQKIVLSYSLSSINLKEIVYISPLLAFTGLFVFIGFGFHYKKIGRWAL